MSTSSDERVQEQEQKQPRPATQHREVVREAGISRLSLVSIVAGTLTAYGAFALIASIAGAILSAADEDTKFATNDWTSAGAIGAMATAFALFLAYLFGGYVAGRMARRSGVLHGVIVFLLGLLAAAAIGGVVAALTDNADVERNLQSIGVPTTADQWGDVGTFTAIAAVVLMALGAILGGSLGERWHTKLARRALDPEYGPDADARRQTAEERAQRDKDDCERTEREADERARRQADESLPQTVSDTDGGLDATNHDGSPDRTSDGDVDHDRVTVVREPIDLDATPGDRATAVPDQPVVLTDGDDQRISASEWAKMKERDDEPRLSPAEWDEIERMQRSRQTRH